MTADREDGAQLVDVVRREECEEEPLAGASNIEHCKRTSEGAFDRCPDM